MTEDGVAGLAAEIAACRVCRDQPAGGPERRLPHEPRPIAVLSSRARILIASQAPGVRAHNSGIPFNDPSGDRLRSWLGVDRAQFYDPDRFVIAPMGFCFPGHDANGGDLPPRRECAPLWRARVIASMPQVELVLAIGTYAQKWHMGALAGPMTETVLNWRSSSEQGSGPDLLPLPHPSWRNSSWLKRNTWFEAELLPVLKDRVVSLI